MKNEEIDEILETVKELKEKFGKNDETLKFVEEYLKSLKEEEDGKEDF